MTWWLFPVWHFIHWRIFDDIPVTLTDYSVFWQLIRYSVTFEGPDHYSSMMTWCSVFRKYSDRLRLMLIITFGRKEWYILEAGYSWWLPIWSDDTVLLIRWPFCCSDYDIIQHSDYVNDDTSDDWLTNPSQWLWRKVFSIVILKSDVDDDYSTLLSSVESHWRIVEGGKEGIIHWPFYLFIPAWWFYSLIDLFILLTIDQLREVLSQPVLFLVCIRRREGKFILLFYIPGINLTDPDLPSEGR